MQGYVHFSPDPLTGKALLQDDLRDHHPTQGGPGVQDRAVEPQHRRDHLPQNQGQVQPLDQAPYPILILRCLRRRLGTARRRRRGIALRWAFRQCNRTGQRWKVQKEDRLQECREAVIEKWRKAGLEFKSKLTADKRRWTQINGYFGLKFNKSQ